MLRTALEAMATPVAKETLIPWGGTDSLISALEAVKQLAPAGLVLRNSDGTVEVAAEARRWLETDDVAVLVEIFHRNLRFVGELLVEVDGGGLTTAEIAEVARLHYQLDWATLDQVNRRTYWLRATGVVELLFTGKVVLTERGREVLARLVVVGRDEFGLIDDEPDSGALDQLSPVVVALLEDAARRGLAGRVAAGMSYVPKGGQYNTVESLAAQVDAATPAIERGEFVEFCSREFTAKPSSSTSALDTVRNTGLLTQIGRDTFAATEAARAWRTSNTVLDLVGIVHANIRCVGELLPLLEENRTIGELAEMARVRFGGLVLKTPVLRNRLQLLREAGLVMQPSFSSYRATSKGRVFACTLPLEVENSANEEKASENTVGTVDSVVQDLIDAAADTAHSDNFERALTVAFQSIGLDAEHLGGAGRTDIVITVRRSPTELVRIIVDAKATKNQAIHEGAVDFSTLVEHRGQHQADHAALVAVGFDSGRVKSRAAATGIALITVDELVSVIERCRVEPLAPVELVNLFIPAMKEKLWSDADRRAEVMAAVIVAVEDESEYVAETGGSFSTRDIHRSLRRSVDPSPDMTEVQEALNLLASPLIQGIKADGRNGYLPGFPAESVAARLRFLSAAVNGATGPAQ
ncbi:restriction endonuclease [Amycolatopsis pretoriensis]|uniref:restriction endonuclease n=1 Tax=Amycolatopsis pretoriensis TaxID=218821 RepID=UPI0013025919|nr:restriction endonuclease [Amycolatopsis pretoriensis]